MIGASIQAAFVDEPRRAVEQADSLVASAMKRLAEVFAEERSKLEHQWDRGDNVWTEDLRIALQRYRSFFHRLLAILKCVKALTDIRPQRKFIRGACGTVKEKVFGFE